MFVFCSHIDKRGINMAIIRKTNGTDITVSAEQGSRYWLVLNNKSVGTEEEQDFCSDIKHIYLNWRKAPDEYIRDNFTNFREKARDEWYVDNQGIPTRPQYDADWEIAKRWKLFNNYQAPDDTNPLDYLN